MLRKNNNNHMRCIIHIVPSIFRIFFPFWSSLRELSRP